MNAVLRMSRLQALLKQVCLFVLLQAGATLCLAGEDWTLARSNNSIKVWTRDIPGYPIREFKAVTTVKSTLGGLVSLLLDTGRAPEWIYRTERVDVLKRDDQKASFVIRIITDFPWPLRDRDAVVAGHISQDENGTVNIVSHSVPDEKYAKDPDYMRMADFEGTWTFRPLNKEQSKEQGKGLVEVTMIGRANPGGSIPAGVTNLIIHETPYQTMRGLRRLIGDARYQSAVVPQIHEVRETQP